MYVVLVENKRDSSDKYFIKKSTLEEAKESAREFDCAPDGYNWHTEIYEIKNNLR